jgi:hypothetical protein
MASAYRAAPELIEDPVMGKGLAYLLCIPLSPFLFLKIDDAGE